MSIFVDLLCIICLQFIWDLCLDAYLLFSHSDSSLDDKKKIVVFFFVPFVYLHIYLEYFYGRSVSKTFHQNQTFDMKNVTKLAVFIYIANYVKSMQIQIEIEYLHIWIIELALGPDWNFSWNCFLCGVSSSLARCLWTYFNHFPLCVRTITVSLHKRCLNNQIKVTHLNKCLLGGNFVCSQNMHIVIIVERYFPRTRTFIKSLLKISKWKWLFCQWFDSVCKFI